MEVLIQPDALVKMLRLLDIVGGRVIDQQQHADFVRLLIEKGPAENLV
jgi:hypothetical protein